MESSGMYEANGRSLEGGGVRPRRWVPVEEGVWEMAYQLRSDAVVHVSAPGFIKGFPENASEGQSTLWLAQNELQKEPVLGPQCTSEVGQSQSHSLRLEVDSFKMDLQ